MPPLYFPLRWESTGDQWWYASPIDCAAASGHYELVRELLFIDANLLIKLTSLRRIRRLEMVWDDQDQFNNVAKCRAHVAKNLLSECETKAGSNLLIRAGYGGWLLYTAASAGEVGFVQDLLQRDPLLVFGEGEFGITDILYAAARSNSSEVFKLLLSFAVDWRSGGDEFRDGFRIEMMNRAVHCAAGGGNLEVLKELLAHCCHVLVYRDAQGSTILHSAAGKGQLEVMKHLVASYEIVNSTDHQGNTALHIAACNGFLPAVETLVAASPSLAVLRNKQGDTFLHMAVFGFQVPGFRRIDQHLELIKRLANSISVQGLINTRNNQGRTALHLAVCDNIQADLVEVLMAIPSIDLNITDANGMTPLDLLEQHPESASSRLLIKHMISAGAAVTCREDQKSRGAKSRDDLRLCSSIGSIPGTSFRVPDSEMFLYAGNEDDSEASCYGAESSATSACSSGSGRSKRLMGSMNSASTVSKLLLQWPKKKDKSLQDSLSLDETPASLRQRFSRGCSLPNNKRAIPIRYELPSPSAKKNFTASLMQGVVIQQPMPRSVISLTNSLPTPSSKSFMSTPDFSGGKSKSKSFRHSENPTKEKLMNHYLCLGAQGLAMEELVSCVRPDQFQSKNYF